MSRTAYTTCPDCAIVGIRTVNAKIARHERGLRYIPYKLYERIAFLSGTSVKNQMKTNLCIASGKISEVSRKEMELETEAKTNETLLWHL